MEETILKFSNKVKDFMRGYLENGKYFILFFQYIEIVRDVTMKV